MTPQEKELLSVFLQQLETAQAVHKDPDAEAQIRAAVAKQPDAAYLLVQRTLQLEQLLEASQQQLKKLEQSQSGEKATGAGGGLGYDWGSRAGAQTQPQTPAAHAAAPGAAAAPGRGAVPPGRAAAGGWGSGLFGNIAATAAGVVAGSFLFQGIQGLMKGDEAQAADAASAGAGEETAAAEPEYLNTYETPEDGGGDFAGLDDSGDFV